MLPGSWNKNSQDAELASAITQKHCWEIAAGALRLSDLFLAPLL